MNSEKELNLSDFFEMGRKLRGRDSSVLWLGVFACMGLMFFTLFILIWGSFWLWLKLELSFVLITVICWFLAALGDAYLAKAKWMKEHSK